MQIQNSDDFQLDAQLAADTRLVTSLALSEVLLVNDSRYLWCILVPRVAGLRDLHDVPAEHQVTLHNEINRVSCVVKKTSQAYKMNVAALGNLVEQLHIHIIARHRDDMAWPGPVWGAGVAEPYTRDKADVLVTEIRHRLE